MPRPRVGFWRRLAFLFTGRVESLRLGRGKPCAEGWSCAVVTDRTIVQHDRRAGASVTRVGRCVYCGVQNTTTFRAEVAS